MREIKFRAWIEDVTTGGDQIKEMISYDELMHYGEPLNPMIGNAECYHIEGKIEWMQYTGLKDKNGKEIYEGDILLVPDEWTEPVLDDGSGPREPCNHLAPVTFNDGSFGILITDKADIYSKGFWPFPIIEKDIGDTNNQMEVIGNIYENLELLKETSNG